jgi:hypothetical protein
MNVFVLFDAHGSGSVCGVITSELVAMRWKQEDSLYRAAWKFTVDEPSVDVDKHRSSDREKKDGA